MEDIDVLWEAHLFLAAYTALDLKGVVLEVGPMPFVWNIERQEVGSCDPCSTE